MFLNTHTSDPARPDGRRNLIGQRWAKLIPVTTESGAELSVWDLETEGGFQFGQDNGEDVVANFFTTVVGHTWKTVPWTPRLAGLFYYGSGDQNPTSGHNNTFNTLFPLVHAYWAISDNPTGQNLYDWEIRGEVKPSKKTGLTTSYHWLSLASGSDRAYNVGGLPVGTPGNGRDLGQALDVFGYYAFNPNFDIQAGYSWFWYGNFIDLVAPRQDATQIYLQTSLRY
ncbi:MAG: hypothetical protein FJ267_18365 [Planctomycetes bacterium]|nr:hypothetical protein [Planctomycetota bacterium]